MTKKAAAANRIAVLAKAIDDLAASRFGLVTMHCGALLARDADDPEASLLSGLAAGASGHMQRAARLLHRAARGRGNAAHPFHDLAIILQRTGRSTQIEPQFHALRRLAPDDASLCHAFGEFLYDSGRCEEAVPILIEAQRLRPDSLPTLNLLAMALASMGHTSAAIAQYRDAIQRDPTRAGAWANLGPFAQGRRPVRRSARRLRHRAFTGSGRRSDQGQPRCRPAARRTMGRGLARFRVAPDPGRSRRAAAAFAPGRLQSARSVWPENPRDARGRLRRHIAFRTIFASPGRARRSCHGVRPGTAHPDHAHGARGLGSVRPGGHAAAPRLLLPVLQLAARL
jgi:Flp pilus assembly protein TadD